MHSKSPNYGTPIILTRYTSHHFMLNNYNCRQTNESGNRSVSDIFDSNYVQRCAVQHSKQKQPWTAKQTARCKDVFQGHCAGQGTSQEAEDSHIRQQRQTNGPQGHPRTQLDFPGRPIISFPRCNPTFGKRQTGQLWEAEVCMGQPHTVWSVETTGVKNTKGKKPST